MFGILKFLGKEIFTKMSHLMMLFGENFFSKKFENSKHLP
jgi:hypothetical protein